MKSFVLVAVALAAVSAPAQPKLLRIVVIDKSSSTSNGPLDEAKRQFREELRKHPPTTRSPISFVAYDKVAQPPKEFTQLSPALAYLDSLAPGGGTEPAEALRVAVELVEKRAAGRDVRILWIHDGDEGDRRITDPQLEKLDALFSARGRQGLAQAVQLRTWSGHNELGTIAARLAANPAVHLVDPSAKVSLAPIVPLSVHCDVVIESVRRGSNPAELIVQFKPQVNNHGPLPKGHSLAPYDVTLQRDGLSKQSAWKVILGTPPISHQVVIAASSSEIEKGRLELRFRMAASTSATSNTDKQTIALAAPPDVVKSVTIPGYPRPYQYAARLTLQGKPRWLDPASRTAAFEAELKLGVRPTDSWVTGHPSVTLKLAGIDGTTVIGGPAQVLFDQPGVRTVTLKLKRSLTQPAKGTGASDRLRLSITAHSASDTASFTPASYVAESGPLPLPAATVTTLKVRLESAAAPLWYKPPNIAAFKVTLRVTVDGLVPSGAEFIVAPPIGTSILRIHPKTFRSGEQTVQLYVAAPLQAAPASNHLEFQFDPPPDTDTIKFLKPAPLTVDLVGPAVARLVAIQDSHVTQTLSRTVPDGTSSVEVPAVFQLTGPVTRTFAAALRAEARGPIVASDLSLYQSVSLPVALSDAGNGNYLFDKAHSVPFEVSPIPSVAPVKPLRLEARVTQQAPFKQHLFLTLAAAVAIAVPYLLVRMALGMRPSLEVVTERTIDAAYTIVS